MIVVDKKPIPKPTEEEELERNPRKACIFDRSFKWWRGPIELQKMGNVYFSPPDTREQYELQEKDALKAFAELAECIESPLLNYSRVKRKSLHEDMEKGFDDRKGYFKREWLYHLYPHSYSDFPKVKQWIEKYGFPSLVTSLPSLGMMPAPSPPGVMSQDDILVITNFVSLAWRLYQLGKTKEGRSKIKDFWTTFRPSDGVILVTFGLSQEEDLRENPYPDELMIQLQGNEENLNPENWPDDTWRRIAYLWVGRVCDYFIDVEVTARFSADIRIHPTLKAKSFLSWLWLLFLTRIGQESETTGMKTCSCGQQYSGRAKFCPDCLLEHKNKLKHESWLRKEEARKKNSVKSGNASTS